MYISWVSESAVVMQMSSIFFLSIPVGMQQYRYVQYFLSFFYLSKCGNINNSIVSKLLRYIENKNC